MLGIFLPLFLATGLIREEMSEGTIHYMLAKPIARGEVLLYRMLGYIGLTWPFIIGICLMLCIITGLTGPGDQFSDGQTLESGCQLRGQPCSFR